MAGGITTIPPGVPFLDVLAAGLLGRAGGDPLALAGTTVLLPTRRAVAALRDAFLRQADGRAMLLPRIAPIGDVDADELDLAAAGGGEIGSLAEAAELPPPIAPLRRQLLLARQILALGAAGGAGARTAGQAARLAAELTRLLDQAQTERLGFDRLATLVPERYAAHWQVTLEFLRIVTEHWPAVLADEGALDPAAWRDRVIAARAAAWRAAPPADPVVIAGSTGSIPATAELMEVVLGLPQGEIVLPGLDREADAASWQAIRTEATHPQHGLARLLDRLATDRADVRTWPEAAPLPPPLASRVRLIGEAMRPAATTDAWRAPSALDGEAAAAALTGVRLVEAPSPREEAAAIALLLREAAETPGRTAALVTPDRGLARRVAAELERWDVAIDDSAGRPLRQTEAGAFLLLVARAAASGAAPVELLACLKHPLAAGGMAEGAFRARVRALELAVLRGPRPAESLAGLVAAVRAWAAAPAEAHGRRGPQPDTAPAALADWTAAVAGLLAPLADAIVDPATSLAALVRAHVAAAERLAASDEAPGARRLWSGEDGEAAAGLVSGLAEAAGIFDGMPGSDYPDLLDELMAAAAVRPRWGRHPRLAILGPLEARLQRFDLVVLGGLNEGTWPAEAVADPWLSRPMRADFGLPPPERRIGLAAHDVAQLLAHPVVVLTRALRVEGTPTVPSRWLMRLDALLRGLGRADLLAPDAAPLAWQAGLDRPDAVERSGRPAPRPPVSARPRRLSITEIETWLGDPYAIYARHVLGLRPLDPLDADPGAAERGSLVHGVLEAFVRRCPGALPEDALDRLLALGRAAFEDLRTAPGVRAFWWPRFARVAEWFVEAERDRRPALRESLTEVKGRLDLDGPGGPFRLTGRADRIDRLAGGGLAILDYKTGALPTKRRVEAGLSPQLPLAALLAEAGGFAGLPPAPVAALAYWRLTGGTPPGEIRVVAEDAEVAALVAEARSGLERLVATFDDPATPYLARPDPRAPGWGDYDHLARVAEWAAASGDAA